MKIKCEIDLERLPTAWQLTYSLLDRTPKGLTQAEITTHFCWDTPELAEKALLFFKRVGLIVCCGVEHTFNTTTHRYRLARFGPAMFEELNRGNIHGQLIAFMRNYKNGITAAAMYSHFRGYKQGSVRSALHRLEQKGYVIHKGSVRERMRGAESKIWYPTEKCWELPRTGRIKETSEESVT